MATEYPFDDSVIRGGIESVAFHLSQALGPRPDIELHIVSFSDKVNKIKNEKRNSNYIHWLKHHYNIKGLQTVRLFTTDIIRLRKIFNKIRPDIFHIQNLSGYALACRKNEKVIISVHGVEAATAWANTNPFYKGIVGFFRLVAERFAFQQSIKRADCLISNSGSYAVSILKRYINDTSIEYIDHPISNEFFPQWSKSPNDELVVLSVAGMSERKRTIDLIKTIRVVTDVLPVKLVLLGHISEKSYYERIIDTIKKLNVEDNVILDTDLNQEKLIEAYKQCSVFVLSSGQETAPMAIAAAMAVGRPIIATRVGGIPMMVKHGVNGFLFEPGDIKMLSDLLIELLSSDDKITEFGKQSRRIAESRFTSEAVTEKTINVYRKLISNKTKKGN